MTKSALAPVVSDFASEVSQRLERLATLAANSFEAAFIDDADRARWLAEVAAWRAG